MRFSKTSSGMCWKVEFPRTVAWPEDLKGFFSVCQFLLLDIDSYGFSCLAGSSFWVIVLGSSQKPLH